MSYSKLRNGTLSARLETDKKYAVLKMGSFLTASAGIGWYILYTLSAIVELKSQGYLVVVDWKNCKLPNYDFAKVGQDNVWEYYFEQPDGISLDEAYASENYFVVDDVSNLKRIKGSPNIAQFVDYFNPNVCFWRENFQKYIRFKQSILDDFNNMLYTMQVKPIELTGLLVRGTDYAELKPAEHAKPIRMERFYEKIEAILENQPDMKMFLATEDSRILEAFEKRYSNKVLSIESVRYSETGKCTLNAINKGVDARKRDTGYLFSLYVLSMCRNIVLAPCGGSIIASLLRKERNGYTYFYEGKNEVIGVIVGSQLERIEKNILMVGNKPLMFYSLNNMKFLGIQKVFILMNKEVSESYENILGDGSAYGLQIKYIVTEDYNIANFIRNSNEHLFDTRTMVMYADTIVYGKDVTKEIREMMPFDGTYAWSLNGKHKEDGLKVKIEQQIPSAIESNTKEQLDGLLIGYYLFDNELYDIVEHKFEEQEMCRLEDILNSYIQKKKLFINNYAKGILCVQINSMDDAERMSNLVDAYKNITGFDIGNFEQFLCK